MNNNFIHIYKNIKFFQGFAKNSASLFKSLIVFCYQVLQICNDFLKIIYSFLIQIMDIQMELTMQQEFLQDLEQFKEQLEIEQTNVWNTGIKYEKFLLELCQWIFRQIQKKDKSAKQILQKISTISFVNVIHRRLNPKPSCRNQTPFFQQKDKVLYPGESYAIYYLFQTLKQPIVRQLKSQYTQIQQLKDASQLYIINSDNLIIYYNWISMIVDLLIYRPILDKFGIFKILQLIIIKWNYLIENNLILTLPYHRNQACSISKSSKIFQQRNKYFNVISNK
ncbi:unnamed protein product [Paramecium pentaurelia]|uniref:Uncharacterized protein n=1 Tax=Paramecium pentaurelia TaxID=43138 RepID=A0A8S1WPY4_9CILI|nr:unnamed protein product [Paramecium pentaurelia]